MENWVVELTLKVNKVEGGVPQWFREMFETYKVVDTGQRIMIDVPIDWFGFRDGTVQKLLDTFGDALYVSLAYISFDRHEIVTDLQGQPVDTFEMSIGGRLATRYVKKRIRVLKVLDNSDAVYTLEGYVLDLRQVEPVIKVLSVYADNREDSNCVLPLSVFNKPKGD